MSIMRFVVATTCYLLLCSSRLVLSSSSAAESSSECTDGKAGQCITNQDSKCLDVPTFQQLVASYEKDESILPLLRGTIDNLFTQEDIDTLVKFLPPSEFVEASGYDIDNNRDGRAYNSPVAYSGIGLQELSTSNESRYSTLLQIREKVRLSTEQSLGLCQNTLMVDFTTISQKTVGSAHKPHADNCLHYYTDRATCDTTRDHPYPNRVAASILYLNNPSSDSGNFSDGDFYFANQSNGEVNTTIPVKAGKMIYFTSGVENLHGALPVALPVAQGVTKDKADTCNNTPPRRLALAMWYVTDKELEEYVPPFQQSYEEKPISSTQTTFKPRKVYDPNDPTAPKELFTIPIPNSMDITSLFQSVGTHLTSSKNNNGSWKINMYGEDTLHVLFTKDHSAMFSIDFGVAFIENDNDSPSTTAAGGGHAQSSIVVERHTDGRKPASLQYMLQESVMLHVVLDVFSTLIVEKLNENIVNEEQQQFFYVHVDKARDTLPARRA